MLCASLLRNADASCTLDQPTMSGEDQPDVAKLLSACSARAVRRMQEELDAAVADPQRAAAIIKQTSPADMQELRSIYVRAVGVTFATTAFSFFGVLPRRTRPLTSAAGAAVVGGVTGTLFGASRMAETILRMAGRPAEDGKPSVLVDQILCPSVREFDPCADDQRCAALMRAQSSTLFECGRRCRERRVSAVKKEHSDDALVVDRATKPSDTAEPVLGTLETDDPSPNSADPYFSGGFRR